VNGGASYTLGSANGYAFPIGTTNVIYKAEDPSGNFITCPFSITVQGSGISGVVTYYNTPNTPMNNVTVTLKQGSTTIASTTTSATGAYSFTGICQGTYDVYFTTLKTAGGINATDAALLNAWVVGPQYSIEKVRFFAGDVANPLWQLLPMDAQRILQYFVTSGSSGWDNRGPWTFWQHGTTITNPTAGTLIPSINITPGGSSLTQNFYAMSTGDFNRSFTPSGAKASHPTLELKYAQTRQVDTEKEFELPIYASAAMELTAISMILDFPSDKVEIIDIYLAGDPSEPMLYNITGDELRIGWQSLLPVTVNAGERMLTMRLRIKGDLLEGESVRFSLTGSELNELADASCEVIDGAVLFIDVIEAATGISIIQTGGKLTFANYPNPFDGRTTFAYTLPADGKVTLELYNIMGAKVKTLLNEDQIAGDHTLSFDGSALPNGVYLVTLQLRSESGQYNGIIKIVRDYE
jgi:hypothetical protein